eukprot:1725321-Rhodomonas_salina.2
MCGTVAAFSALAAMQRMVLLLVWSLVQRMALRRCSTDGAYGSTPCAVLTERVVRAAEPARPGPERAGLRSAQHPPSGSPTLP